MEMLFVIFVLLVSVVRCYGVPCDLHGNFSADRRQNWRSFFDPYADPYGKWTVWTQWLRVVSDLRDFLGKGAKPLEPQRKIPIFAAHNPEVVGSSPASATRRKDF